jgi:hypothetical protein
LEQLAAQQDAHKRDMAKFEARLDMIKKLHNCCYNNLKCYAKDQIGDMLVNLHRAKRMKTNEACNGEIVKLFVTKVQREINTTETNRVLFNWNNSLRHMTGQSESTPHCL